MHPSKFTSITLPNAKKYKINATKTEQYSISSSFKFIFLLKYSLIKTSFYYNGENGCRRFHHALFYRQPLPSLPH